MTGFGARLKELQEAVSDSQSEFARQIGQTPQKLSAWISETNQPRADVISSILEKYPELNIHWLLRGEGQMWSSPGLRASEAPPGPPVHHIPVVSQVAAGVLVEQYVRDHPDETIPFDAAEIARYDGDVVFGLRVVGDSMIPWMWEGDVAICSAVRSVEVGDDVCVYRYESGRSTVKRLDSWNRQRGIIRLRPLNPEQDPFTVELREGDQVKRVIGVYRDLSRRTRTIGL